MCSTVADNQVIKFDNLRTRSFIEILTSDSEPETSKASRNGVALIFSRFFGCAKFLGVFNAPKSLPNQPSLHQFCTMHDPDVVDVWQNESGSNYIFFRETLTWKGYAHVTVSAKFPPLGINILEKILVELKIANKKESIGMFFVFLAIFSCRCQIFGV